MTQQVINVGASLGDHTGDDGRTAFTKVNANFTDLYGRSSGVVNNQTASYQLVAGDAGSIVRLTSASAATITIPQNVLPVGCQLLLVSGGAGLGTVVAGS